MRSRGAAHTTLPGRTTTSSVVGSTSVSKVDRLRRRLGVQHRLDAQAQRRLQPVLRIDQRARARTGSAARSGGSSPRSPAAAPRAGCASLNAPEAKVGHAVADRRGRELRHVRRPRAPAPPGVQQRLEIAAHRFAQRHHRIRRRRPPDRAAGPARRRSADRAAATGRASACRLAGPARPLMRRRTGSCRVPSSAPRPRRR